MPKYSSKVNIINEANFKQVVQFVFEKVSSILSRSLGPYGGTTIIEKFGDIHITKDGWNILKKIHFEDIKANTILNLLVKIASQVVVNVGDGSTSAIVSANKLYKILNKSEITLAKRPKEIVDELSETVNLLVKEIEAKATMINTEEENWSDHIHRVALVSTNNNHDIANIIEKIYKETNNPTIEFGPSKTNSTEYEIVNGYKLSRCPYLDRIYINSETDGKCIINRPMVMMFDTTLDIENSIEYMNLGMEHARKNGQRLLILVPYIDRFVMDRIKQRAMTEFETSGVSSVVFARPNLTTDFNKLTYKDLSILLGTEIITDEIVMMRRRDVEQHRMETSIALQEASSENPPSVTPLEAIDIIKYIGECNSAVIDHVDTLLSGFFNTNTNLYNISLKDATARYETEMDLSKRANNLSTELYNAKQRLAKLRTHMGIIHVGGDSNLEKTANMDLVEDAIKACESAFYNGYNTGGNIAIITACIELEKKYPNNDFLPLIEEAFVDTLYEVLHNKYKKTRENKVTAENTEQKIISEIEKMIEEGKCMSIIDNDDKEIINSSMTDIEILRAIVSIISLLISSNQYVTIEPMK